MLETTKSVINTQQFLTEIHNEKSLIHFNVGNKTWKKPRAYNEDFHKTLSWLNTTENKDICFIVNSGGTKNSQINRINAVFIDWDCGKDEDKNYFPLDIVSKKKAEFLPKLDEFPHKPSFIVETRNGFHVYWLLHLGTSNDQFISIQKRLACFFNSDPGIYTPSHVMRLPGYNWTKPSKNCAPFPVIIVLYNSCRYYSFDILNSLSGLSGTGSGTSSDTGTTEDYRTEVSGITEVWTHNKERIKEPLELLWVQKPSLPRKIILKNLDEVADYLKSIELTDYLNLDNISYNQDGTVTVSCPFHTDSSPSASILTKGGSKFLKCHSSDCSFDSGTIIKIAAREHQVDEGKAVKMLMEQFNIEIDKSWIKEQKEIINKNISIIEKIHKNTYPDLHRCIGRIKRDLISKLEFAGDKIKLQNSEGVPLFFCSLRQFEKVAGKILLSGHHNGQNLKVDRYCLLGLMKKLQDEEIGKTLLSEAISQKQSLEGGSTEDEKCVVTYRIQFYSIPAYTDEVLAQANQTARILKEHGIRMNSISWDTVYQVFGLEKVKEVYPQVDKEDISDSGREFMDKVEAVLVGHVEAKGYSKVSNIVAGMQEEYDWKTVTDRRVKKYIPGLLMKHNLKEVVVNKELKGKYSIQRKGYPKIIVRKDS